MLISSVVISISNKMVFRRVSFSTIIRTYCKSACLKEYFVSSPIFYVNAPPHIGHLYTAVICDAANRFSKLLHGRKGNFSVGTDEHGMKIQQAAQKFKLPIKDYCNNISEEYANMFKDFGVDYSIFIRTTDPQHKLAVEKFWTNLNERGHIYTTKYCGWYCTSDETFLTDSQIAESANNNTKVSIETGHPVEWTEEQNYMFRLGHFKDDLNYWLKDENVIKPKKYHKMVSDWINCSDRLPDLSISRPVNRVHWGIPVPGDETQTVYVWLDALVNYLTAAGYPDTSSIQFRTRWPPNLHVIGKDILKFHAIYWPAFLMAVGLSPPQSILCHAHWTVNGEKMSKSKNNVIAPNKCAEQYGAEGVRYFLLREGVAHSDGNYSENKIRSILNSELADTLGNLLSRCCGSILNPKQEFPKLHDNIFDKMMKDDVLTKRLVDSVKQLPDIAKEHYISHNYYKVVDATIATLHAANAFFESQKPWELRRADRQEELEFVLHLTMETLRVCGILLSPIIPCLSRRLLDKLSIDSAHITWKDVLTLSWEKSESSTCSLSTDNCVLYKRISPKK